MPKTPPAATVKSAYTQTEKDFLVEYVAWAERNDITSKSALYAGLNELMPWRTEQSIRNFMSNHPELFGKRNIPPQSTRRPLSRVGLEYRLQQSQQKNPASPAEVRQSKDVESQNSITSAIDEGLASSPDDHRPQAITSSAKGKAPSILSEAVTEAMVLALKDHPESHWASDNRQKRARLWKDFSKTHPNHSAESYYQYHVEHHEQLESAARELTEDGGHINGPSKWPGFGIRNDLNPVIDSLIKEGKLEDPVIPPLSPSGSFYDQKDCLAVIQYLADNPSLFYGSTEVPLGASTRLALWRKFEAGYKTRTAIAWAEFHRAHHSALEEAARKLNSIRQEREHDDPWHESSPPSTVDGNAESQPSARGSSVLGFILQIPNLLKRSVQDDAESSSPSKRVKFEDS
ncbi:hypothetical protein FRC04_001964 [Tulasnella sp. 424]|nr:hypothetical protein FRC04_001964 [Tulasnella sp. 424]